MIKQLIFFSIITSMIGNASVFAIDLGIVKLSLFRVSILLLFVYMMIKLIKDKKIRINNLNANNYSIKFIFFWVIYAFFSLAWVKDYNAWVRAVFFLCIGFLVFVIFSKYFKSKFDVLLAFKLIFIMVLFHNLLGWYEIFTGNYIFLSTDDIATYTILNLPVSTFGNTNDFATFMLFSVWVSYICFSNTKNKILRFIYMGSIVSSGFLLITATSRANLLGLLLSIIVFIVLSMSRKRTRNFILVCLWLLFLIVLFNPKIIESIFVSMNQNLSFNFSMQNESDSVRLNLIMNGLFFLISSFGFGVGAGNIEYWMSRKAIYNTQGVINIHNWWIEILVGYGIIIFLLYLLFYARLFKTVYKIFKNSRNKIDMSISLGILCFMGGYLIGSISSSSNIGSEWLWVFWGIAVAYQGTVDNKQKIIDNKKEV